LNRADVLHLACAETLFALQFVARFQELAFAMAFAAVSAKEYDLAVEIECLDNLSIYRVPFFLYMCRFEYFTFIVLLF
jgi:hypothetical protein